MESAGLRSNRGRIAQRVDKALPRGSVVTECAVEDVSSSRRIDGFNAWNFDRTGRRTGVVAHIMRARGDCNVPYTASPQVFDDSVRIVRTARRSKICQADHGIYVPPQL